MLEDKFEECFENLISEQVEQDGFRRSNKHLYFIQGDICVSLIRLGGKMYSPNSVAHILCFRHTYLPNLNEKISKGLEKEVFSYPFKFKPRDVVKDKASTLRYVSQNLNYDYERFDYSRSTETDVLQYLEGVKQAMLTVIEWAQMTSVSELEEQIKSSKEMGWLEGIWIKSYGEHQQ